MNSGWIPSPWERQLPAPWNWWTGAIWVKMRLEGLWTGGMARLWWNWFVRQVFGRDSVTHWPKAVTGWPAVTIILSYPWFQKNRNSRAMNLEVLKPWGWLMLHLLSADHICGAILLTLNCLAYRNRLTPANGKEKHVWLSQLKTFQPSLIQPDSVSFLQSGTWQIKVSSSDQSEFWNTWTLQPEQITRLMNLCRQGSV